MWEDLGEDAVISTHALTWSATLPLTLIALYHIIFQLTHSRGVRRSFT